jgi:hypothetical protein
MGHFLREINTNNKSAKLWTLWGNYLTICYLFIKVLYVVIVATSLGLIAHIMGTYTSDIERILNIAKGEYDSEYLPPAVLCRYDVMDLGKVIHHALSCTLPQNELNQMILLFLSCWFVFLLLVNVICLTEYVITSFFTSFHGLDISGTLSGLNKYYGKTSEIVTFVKQFLHRDGILIARLVSLVSSDLISSQMIGNVWQFYTEWKEESKGEDEPSTRLSHQDDEMEDEDAHMMTTLA